MTNIILIVFDSLRKDCVGAYGTPPWGKVHTPNLDAFANDSLMMTRAYPESLPTLPARRALYTGQRVYPFCEGETRLKGDFVGAPGWGPIPEHQATLSELLQEQGYRTALISDVYHMFKPSKNFWRGFDQWTFLRGQEEDPYRSGPRPSAEDIARCLPEEMRKDEGKLRFTAQSIMNLYDRTREEDYFAARVFKEASTWLEQNQDTKKFFLTIESFNPHEPWLVPEHYRRMYTQENEPLLVLSGYNNTSRLDPGIIDSARASYSGLVTFCDRWFGYFMESLRVLGLLDQTLIIVTSDHGHSIGDRNYLGKRGYPSAPEVYEIPLLLKYPDGQWKGQENDQFVQHTDISAEILSMAGMSLDNNIHGQPLSRGSGQQAESKRDHITIAWGAAVTVIDERWWLNCRVNGKGSFLYDLSSDKPFEKNCADEFPEVVKNLFAKALMDAGGPIPQWLIDLADKEVDAPGCSSLAARA